MGGMLSKKNSLVTFFLFFLAPTLGVFTNWFGFYFSAFVYGFVIFLLLLSKPNLRLDFDHTLIIIFLALIIGLSALAQVMYSDVVNIDIGLFFIQPFLIMIAYNAIFLDIKFSKKYLMRLLKYIILLNSLAIIYDWFVLEFFDASLRILSTDNVSYQHRALGLHGQPTVNSVFLISLYCLLVNLEKKIRCDIYLFIVVFSVCAQRSGWGIILMFLFFIYVITLYKGKMSRGFVLSLVIFFFPVLYFSVTYLGKLSGSYILYIVNYLIDNVGQLLTNFNTVQIFGPFNQILKTHAPVEFSALFAVSNVSTIFGVCLLVYLALLFRILKGARRVFFGFLILGSFYYPTLFYLSTGLSSMFFIVVSYENKDRISIK
ncbi:hypothetical protein OAW18_05825 [Alphaproteobacteria bacterium]|nr:hypothetical protein [Alphaproteobacteria bacterium]